MGWEDVLASFGTGDGKDALDPSLYSLTGGEGFTPSGSTSFNLGRVAEGVSEMGTLPDRAPTPWFGGALNTLGDVAKVALPVAQIGGAAIGGITALQAGKQSAQQSKVAATAGKRQDEIARTAAAAAQPLTSYGKTQLDAATQGRVPDAERARIEEWKAAALHQVRDYLARAGLGDSEALLQWTNYIERQAKAMEAGAITQEAQLGISASGTAGNILAGAAGAEGQVAGRATQESASLDQLIAQSNQQLARLSAGAA